MKSTGWSGTRPSHSSSLRPSVSMLSPLLVATSLSWPPGPIVMPSRRGAAAGAFAALASLCSDAPALADRRDTLEDQLPPPGLTPAGVPEADLPPAVVMLRAISQCTFQEQALRRTAALSTQERFDQGMLVGRQQVAMSVELLLGNTKLDSLPGCTRAASTLARVRGIATSSSGPLTNTELRRVAALYAVSVEQIRTAYEQLPEKAQREGAAIEGTLRAADEAATQPYWSDGGRFAKGRLGLGAMEEDESEMRARREVLGKEMAASAERRRRLGQRSGASELNRDDLEKALYGDRVGQPGVARRLPVQR